MAYIVYEGSKTPITFEVDRETTQFVLHLVDKSRNKIIGKFAYPLRDGYELAVKTDNNYDVIMLPEMTIGMANQQMRADMWFKLNDNFMPSVSKIILIIEDTTTKNILPL